MRRTLYTLSACALLAACASRPPTVSVVSPPRDSPSPVFKPEEKQPDRPLPAAQLRPFDGATQEVREPLRGVAKLDRTVTPDDVWQRIRNGFAMPDLDSPLVAEKVAW